MSHRKRRANVSSGRSRMLNPAQSLPPQPHRSPRPYARSTQARSAYANEFDGFRHRRSTSTGPSASFQRRPRVQSTSGNATAFKASIHSNPHLASRCRTLKLQTTSLKQKLEELIALVEELQPENSAMDWAASSSTVIYVPTLVTRDNQAPRASPAHPEAKGPERSTFPDSSQYSNKTENCFGSGNATFQPGHRRFEQTNPQAQPGQTDWENPRSHKQTENYSGLGNAANPSAFTSFSRMQPQAKPGQTNWASPFETPFTLPRFGGQADTTTNMDSGRAARPRPGVAARATHKSAVPRHAYVEDATDEESGNGGM